jgi:hypothetical protein
MPFISCLSTYLASYSDLFLTSLDCGLLFTLIFFFFLYLGTPRPAWPGISRDMEFDTKTGAY